MNLTWHCKPFESLSAKELYNILRLRTSVFILEQNCLYQDVDGKDIKALHLFATENENVIAYARIFAPGAVYEEASIGRVATAKEHRGKGLGIILMQKAMEFIKKEFDDPAVRISAQSYLIKFYSGFGFKISGNEYLEDDIPHTAMIYPGK
jgi:ElaA protein